MDPITRLQESIDQTRSIVAALDASDLGQTTPCTEWDVESLANHLFGALVMFRDVATLGAADMGAAETDHHHGNLLEVYDTLTTATVEAWQAEGRVDGVANMPWGQMPAEIALQVLADDIVVHGWDFATATGQQIDWDQVLAAETLEFAQMIFSDPDARAGSFADAVPVAEDADAMTRLVTFLGRHV